MADRARFGPAGFPVGRDVRGPDAMAYLREVGLDAMEYQAVRSVRMKAEKARVLGQAASENDILLAIHAPYAINLASKEKSKLKGSKDRLYAACTLGYYMGAVHCTFHPGYYKELDKDEAFKMVKRGVEEVVERLKQERIKIKLGPETTGKPSQVGSLDEVLELAAQVDMVEPTIDFAHIHAREGGVIKSKEDYARILDKIESTLGSDAVKNMFIHFSEIELTSKGVGEKQHHELGSGYGPDFKPLAQLIAERGLTPVIICETPLLDLDAIKMKKIYQRALRRARR
ncbi:MAG: deoxyribonuclease IV [Thermoproteota archaeon]|nr:MAG: deoxyribonuclease IV [Candidatus Korarchaeota archaeon]RLG56055.1 MAG: deoxyribonuclease IV [Candidatus Korarchaeota archaeon]